MRKAWEMIRDWRSKKSLSIPQNSWAFFKIPVNGATHSKFLLSSILISLTFTGNLIPYISEMLNTRLYLRASQIYINLIYIRVFWIYKRTKYFQSIWENTSSLKILVYKFNSYITGFREVTTRVLERAEYAWVYIHN